jgi:ethanolamine utilization protein EutQ (cupin superfamily)
LITSREKAEDQTLDVVISPVDEKQFRNTVVSVLLNKVLSESRRMDQILDSCAIQGKAGLA